LSNLLYDFYGQGLACAIFLGFLHLFTNLNVEGLWLPLLLYTFAQPIFNYFLLAYMKNKSYESARNVLTVIVIIGIFGGTGIAFLAISAQKRYIALALECILCAIPNFAGGYAFIKILYRV